MSRKLFAVVSALMTLSAATTTSFAASNTSEPPLSFSTAVNQLNTGQFDAALQSAQQTVKNEPNSIYAYRSYVLEAVILRSKMFGLSQTFGGLIDGLQAKNSSKLSAADRTYLTTQARALLDQDTKTYFPKYEAVVQHVANDFPAREANYKYNLSYKHTTDNTVYSAMATFKQNGYPTLSNEQLTKFEAANETDGFVYFESVLQQGMAHILYDFAVGLVQNEPNHQSGSSMITAVCTKIKVLLKNQPNQQLSSEVDALLKTAQSG